MTSNPAKVCEICKQDVSTKPRVKDAQGRYVCKECVPKLEARQGAKSEAPKPPATARAAGGAAPALGDDFWSSPMQPGQGATLCPGCSNVLVAGSVLCTRCGYDLAKGRSLRTQVVRAPKEKKEKGERSPGQSRDYASIFAVVLIFVMALLGAAGLFMPEMAMVLYAVSALAALGVSITAPFIAFKDGHTGWGIAMALAIVLPIMGLAQLFYVYFINDRALLKLYYTAALVGAIASLVLLFGHVQNEAGKQEQQSGIVSPE